MFKELPLVIDSHVHFRTPGAEHKENWVTASWAALRGGIGMVFDMPNNRPSIDSVERLRKKEALIKLQLLRSGYPVKYKLYFGATANNQNEIRRLKGNKTVCGVKLFMGSSTGDLLVTRDDDIREVFKAAKDADLIVSVHAEDEERIQCRMGEWHGDADFGVHSRIRDPRVATLAISRAINLAREVGNRLYFCHISSGEGLELIRQAKDEGLPVYAEACPHHLFFTDKDYICLQNRVKMNPPVRGQEDVRALWGGLNDGTIDVLATDHAPHTLEEKRQDVWHAPSGVPGIETVLPLMLDSVNQGKISLEKLADLMHNNVIRIFNLGEIEGKTIVDMDLEREVKDKELKTRCGWSPYAGMKLRGWPVKIIVGDDEHKCFEN